MRPAHYILALLLVTALGLRIHEIGYSFDGDEVYSVRTVRSSFQSMIETSLWDKPHPPLFNILLFGWVRVMGHSEPAARSLSILLSLATLLVLYRIGLRLSNWSAVWGVGLVALSPFCIYYGRQVRPFALAAFLGTLSVLLLLKIRENPERRIWSVAYGFCCAALIHTQYLALPLLGAQIALVLWARFAGKGLACASGALGVLSVLPWALTAGLTESGKRVRDYIGWFQIPRPSDFVYLFVEIFGELPWKNTSRILVLALAISFVAVALYRKSTRPEALVGLAVLSLCQPFAAFLASYAFSTSVWAPRHFMTSIMLFLVFVGYSLTLHRKQLSGVLAVFFFVWIVLAMPSAFPANVNPPWRDISALLAIEHPQHQLVASEGWVQIPLEYYSEKPVRLWNESTSAADSGLVVFVCRPATCQRLKSLRDAYELVEAREFTWGRTRPDADRKILIYALRRVA